MYKVNLLSEGDFLTLPPEVSGSKPKSSKLLLALIVLLAIGGIATFVLQSNSENEIANKDVNQVKEVSKNLKAPEKTPKKITPTQAIAIEETVTDVKVAQKPKPKAPPLGYPSENIAGQRVAIQSMLEKILNASGDGVGYSSLILQAPNYYYMHGLAPTSKEYVEFKDVLKKSSEESKVSKEKNRGISGKAKEFTIYGKFNLPSNSLEKNKKLNYKLAMPQTLDRLKSIATKSGLVVENVMERAETRQGEFTRKVVRLQFNSTYKTLFPFLKGIKNSELPLGVLQLTMKATPNEEITGVFDLVVYKKNK